MPQRNLKPPRELFKHEFLYFINFKDCSFCQLDPDLILIRIMFRNDEEKKILYIYEQWRTGNSFEYMYVLFIHQKGLFNRHT